MDHPFNMIVRNNLKGPLSVQQVPDIDSTLPKTPVLERLALRDFRKWWF